MLKYTNLARQAQQGARYTYSINFTVHYPPSHRDRPLSFLTDLHSVYLLPTYYLRTCYRSRRLRKGVPTRASARWPRSPVRCRRGSSRSSSGRRRRALRPGGWASKAVARPLSALLPRVCDLCYLLSAFKICLVKNVDPAPEAQFLARGLCLL